MYNKQEFLLKLAGKRSDLQPAVICLSTRFADLAQLFCVEDLHGVGVDGEDSLLFELF